MAKITLTQLRDDLRRAGDAGVRRVVLRVMTAAALQGEREAKLNVTNSILHVRTGRLRASISGSVREDGDGVVLRLAAGGQGARGEVPYARIHEFGGTILPKRGKYLAIPMGPVKTAAGVARGGPRDFPDLVFAIGPGGPFLGKRSKRNKRNADGRGLTPWFLLRRSVTIPRRPYLRPAFDSVAARVPELLRTNLIPAIGGA